MSKNFYFTSLFCKLKFLNKHIKNTEIINKKHSWNCRGLVYTKHNLGFKNM